MATKIIKALINGVVQDIEVEDIISPEQPLSYEERLEELEDKPIITDGNLLVGNGTEDLEEMTPEEVLSHINGASVATMTTEEFEALSDEETNANTLYMLTDSEDNQVGQKTDNGGEIFNDYENNIIENDDDSNMYAHAEGSHTTAGWRSHSEGYLTLANSTSHAEGRLSKATGKASHAEGAEIYIDVENSLKQPILINKFHIDDNQVSVMSGWEDGVVKVGDFVSFAPTDNATGFVTTDSKRIVDIQNPSFQEIATANIEGCYADSSFLVDLDIDIMVGDYVSFSNDVSGNKYLVTEVDFEGPLGDVYFDGEYIPEFEELVTVYKYMRATITLHAPFRAENYYENWNAPEDGFIPAGSMLRLTVGTIATELGSHAEGVGTSATGKYSHSEGYGTVASGIESHAEGFKTQANGAASHAEGINTHAEDGSAHAEGYGTQATGTATHAEGYETEAIGKYSHAEGYSTKAIKTYSHAEGYGTTANGDASHAEGQSCEALDNNSHAEGSYTKASGHSAHTEGFKTITSGNYSHAEGYETQANGAISHAEGVFCIVDGTASHAEGRGTKASGNYQHVQGQYNVEDTSMAHIVGWGTSDTKRKNIHTLDTSGNAWYSGSVSAAKGIVVNYGTSLDEAPTDVPNGTLFILISE